MTTGRTVPRIGHLVVVWDRLLAALGTGTLAAVLLPARLGWPVRAAAAFDCGALAFLVLAWRTMLRTTPELTRRDAARRAPGRTAVLTVVLAASSTSLGATAALLRHARELEPGEGRLLVALGLAAAAIAWLLAHTAFSFHYAYLYYHHGGEGGLEFPGGGPPDALDFALFALTVGMTFQPSTAAVTSRPIRRVLLVHALLSFAFNTLVLALTLNLIFAVLQTGSL